MNLNYVKVNCDVFENGEKTQLRNSIVHIIAIRIYN